MAKKQILSIIDTALDHLNELKRLLHFLLNKHLSKIIKTYMLKNNFNFSKALIKNFSIKDDEDYSQYVQNYLSNLCNQSKRRIKCQED